MKSQQNNSANIFVNKMTVKSECLRIDRMLDDVVGNALNRIIDEITYINNNLSYSSNYDSTKKVLSDEDKEALIKKVLEGTKELPNKIRDALSDLPKVNDLDEKDGAEYNQEKPKLEIEIEKTVDNVPDQIASSSPIVSNFGY
jgi:hypothetical protein